MPVCFTFGCAFVLSSAFLCGVCVACGCLFVFVISRDVAGVLLVSGCCCVSRGRISRYNLLDLCLV